MAIYLRGKNEIKEYFASKGKIDIKSVSLATIEYLINVEKMSIEDIADLFETSYLEVSKLIERNGL